MRQGGSIKDYDWWLLATVFGICGVGVLEIWSATHASHLTGMHFHQMYWILLGVVCMGVLSRVDYHRIMDQAPVLYLIAIAALITVLAVVHSRFCPQRGVPLLFGFFYECALFNVRLIVVLAR